MGRAAATLLLLLASLHADEKDAIAWRVARLRHWGKTGAGDPAIETKVRAHLEDDAPRVRIEAARALLRLRADAPDALAVLRAELGSSNPDAATWAGSALASLGDRGVAVLIAELRAGRSRIAAMQGLADEATDPAVLPALAGVLTRILDTATDPREIGIGLVLAARHAGLAGTCVPRALPHLRDGMLVESVLDLLEAAGPKASFVDPLRAFIHAEGLEFPSNGYGLPEFEMASSILCRCGPRGIQVVLDRLADIEYERHVHGLRVGLETHLDLTFGPLLEAARSPKPRLRERVLGIVAQARGARLRRVAVVLQDALLNDPDAQVRAAAAFNLYHVVGELGEVADAEALRVAVAEHADDRVRRAALEGLLAVDAVSVADLTALAGDRSRGIRITVVDALSRIAPVDERVIEAAIGLLESGEPLVAVMAVARVGPPARRAEARLRALVADENDAVRLWTRLALWRIKQERSDLDVLLRELEACLLDFREHPNRPYAVEILLALGADARSLVPAIDRVLRTAHLFESEREALERAKRGAGD